MEKIKFISYDGKELACFVWDDVKNPKGVIQIIHGMTSHMMRYDSFAKQLNSYCYIAFGDDHRPHGQTAGIENLGKASGNNFLENVLDEIEITRMLIQKYNLPVQLFAHSYGSFLAQRYIEIEDNLIDGAIISGSSHMGGKKLVFGKILTGMQRLFYTMDRPNQLLFDITFNSNNRYFKEDGVKNAWLNRDIDKVKKYNDDPYCNFLMTHGFYYSMMRGLSDIYKPSNLLKIRKDLPLLIMSGAKDPLGGMGEKVRKLYELYISLGLVVNFKLYPDVRHELTGDPDNDKIVNDMVTFYDNNIKRDR